ncbi:MAG: hydantoinase B/oxoprolinase family protein [Candidatus Hodarchaeales archaeon]
MVVDLITLAVIQKSIENIAEEMGIVLKRASFSPNCKERLDFSCAIFNSQGELLGQAEHIPVHLGAMFSSMETILVKFPKETLKPGDIIILNSPYEGGTHLPDITFVMPVFIDNSLKFFVSNRAHAADIGGATPGSMPGVSIELFEEGLIIPPIKLYSEGKQMKSVIDLILANVRVPTERLGDFKAQRAALLRGEERLIDLAMKYGIEKLEETSKLLLDLSEKSFLEQLDDFPDGEYSYFDFLDSNGLSDEPVKIQVGIKKQNRKLKVDFEGTDPQQEGNVNAPKSVVYSCVYYVFRSLTDPTIMTNAGLFRNIDTIIPKGSFLDPKLPAAVSSGNVETSQRIVDVLLGALSKALPHIPAASQGTMNNVSIGGKDLDGKAFTYYETIAGGAGGAPSYEGVSGIHSHMTNTLNTPIEALELSYPVRVKQYSFRDGSGGIGQFRGGDGIIREIECLVDSSVSLQTERRKFVPYGLKGGSEGKKGVNLKKRLDGTQEVLPGRAILRFKAGESLIILTPGGGGYGKK